MLVCQFLTRCSSLLLAGAVASLSLSAQADVGRAGFYQPPYVPTACYGRNTGPVEATHGNFVAAGPGTWDNGAACGRKYRMRCISGPNRPCIDPNRIIVVTVVDRCKGVCSTSGGNASMKMPTTVAQQLVKSGAAKFINIEYAPL